MTMPPARSSVTVRSICKVFHSTVGRIKQTTQKSHRVNKKLTRGAYTDVFAPRHLTHVKQRKTPQNQVQNYGSKLKVQNPPGIGGFCTEKNSQLFQGHVLTLAVPKKPAFE